MNVKKLSVSVCFCLFLFMSGNFSQFLFGFCLFLSVLVQIPLPSCHLYQCICPKYDLKCPKYDWIFPPHPYGSGSTRSPGLVFLFFSFHYFFKIPRRSMGNKQRQVIFNRTIPISSLGLLFLLPCFLFPCQGPIEWPPFVFGRLYYILLFQILSLCSL